MCSTLQVCDWPQSHLQSAGSATSAPDLQGNSACGTARREGPPCRQGTGVWDQIKRLALRMYFSTEGGSTRGVACEGIREEALEIKPAPEGWWADSPGTQGF